MNGPHRPRRLREAHAHLAEYGRSLAMTSFADCRSRAGCLGSLREDADKRGDGWYLAHSLRVEGWDDPRHPTRAELDAIFGSRPCVLLSFDYHSAVANTAAMSLAGLTPTSHDPAGGVVVRDIEGEATGLLLETAAKMVWQAAPEPTREERMNDVRLGLRSLAAHGFVEIHDMLSQRWLGPILAELADAGELEQKVLLYVPMSELEATSASARTWSRQRVQLAGGKLFADGTLNSKTAWLLAPYRDPIGGMECGKPLYTLDEITAAIASCRSLDLELAVHAIGDGAVRACLDAVARSRRGSMWGAFEGSMGYGSGVRIEHAELIDAADVGRFAELGVVASVQPCHLLYDIDVLRRQLPHRLERVMPIRDLIAGGLVPGKTLLFGSDVPIVRPNPGDSIQAAVHRGRTTSSECETIALSQGIPETEAWQAFAV